MSWKKFYFGNEKPSLKRQCLTHFAMFFIMSSPYAFIADFSPESWVFYTGLGISILVTLISIFFMWNVRERLSFLMYYGFIKRIMVIGYLLLMAFSFTGAFTIYTIPGLTTNVIGQNVSVHGKFDKKDGVSRKSCQYRLSSRTLKYRFPPYLCVSKKNGTSINLTAVAVTFKLVVIKNVISCLFFQG